MTTIDALISTRVHLPIPSRSKFRRSVVQRCRKNANFGVRREIGIGTPLFSRRPLLILSQAQTSSGSSAAEGEDFVTRVLTENPSQVEPKYLIDGKFYTLKEKEELTKRGKNGVFEVLKRLNLKALWNKEAEREAERDGSELGKQPVYLKDILRKYKGKLYVPEQVFEAPLSEEEEFDKKLEELPKMSLENFEKFMIADKVKLLTSKEPRFLSRYRDFIVHLKDIPGESSLHRTQW